MFADISQGTFFMKKFLVIALTSLFVTSIQCMEPVENNAVNNGLAKKITYGSVVAKQTTLNFGQTQTPRSISKVKTQPIKVRKARNKVFSCLECDTAFLSEKNLTNHKTFSYCGKKANQSK